MPDIADDAAGIVEAWNDRCVRQARRALEGEGTLLCEDCEQEIPPRRRELMPSATRCATCQQKVEDRRRG